MLKQDILEKEGGMLLSNCTNNNIELTDTQKCKCVNFVVDFGVLLFGLNPQTHQYKNLAIAAVDLMPALKSSSGSPTVSLIAFGHCDWCHISQFTY